MLSRLASVTATRTLVRVQQHVIHEAVRHVLKIFAQVLAGEKARRVMRFSQTMFLRWPCASVMKGQPAPSSSLLMVMRTWASEDMRHAVAKISSFSSQRLKCGHSFRICSKPMRAAVVGPCNVFL